MLAQRLRIVQAARLRAELIAGHGEDGAFPAPHTLRRLDLDLPARKSKYLRAVAEAALDGLLDGAALRALDPGQAVQRVQKVKGLGPFAAELVVVRGANTPDALPRHERRLDAEISERYGPGRTLDEVSQGWRPYELPRVFRTGKLRLFHAASCPFRYSSRTSCGVRYPSVEWRRVLL